MMLVNKHRWQTIASALGACVVGYFIYHTVQGDRGWLAMVRLQQQVHVAEDGLSQLQKDRQQLEHRVQLMRPESMDPDLLDEKSRELLDYSKPGDVIVLTPKVSDDTKKTEDFPQRSK